MSMGDDLLLQDLRQNRLLILIDASSLFYAASTLGIEIDYIRLLETLRSQKRLVFAYYYTGFNPGNKKQQAFLRWMQSNGYRVISKEIAQVADGNRKADLTVEMAVDMLTLSSRCDTVLLLSGNGNLLYAVQTIARLGLRIELVSLRDMTSDSLMTIADQYTDLGSIKDSICKL
jgi:uncharacterized LabA/DUF88 family protein